MVIKAAVLLVLAVLFKLKGADKWLFALGLAQAGEFGFVLLSFTVANAVIPAPIADQLLLVVALSMLLTPLLFIVYERIIAPRYNRSDERGSDEIHESNRIIIAGHGRVGGIVSRMLRAAGYTSTVIDFSAKQLEMLSKFGFKAYFGDATRPDMLHSAGIAEAKLLVIAIDNKEQITQMVHYVHMNYPQVHIVARAVDRQHVYALWHAGCRDIIRESYDSSLRMGRSAFEALGASPEQAERVKHAFDQMDRKSMIAMAEHYDPELPSLDNEVYVAKAREMAGEWESDLNAQMMEILQRNPAE
jgi:CPA2 family monovalent cation:H+ antiporter-2